MKLVEILARELKEWPNGHDALTQWKRNCEITGDDGRCLDIRLSELSEDYLSVYVTRAQWEAERARIALEQATEVAKQDEQDHAWMREKAQKEKELAELACGKRSNEDQELRDKVAIAVLPSAYSIGYRNSTEEEISGYAFDVADAFMAERAKRMKG